MRTIDSLEHGGGLRRFRQLQGQITLLNRGWHRRRGAARIGICAGCEQEIRADERAVHLHGELYHSSCVL